MGLKKIAEQLRDSWRFNNIVYNNVLTIMDMYFWVVMYEYRLRFFTVQKVN